METFKSLAQRAVFAVTVCIALLAFVLSAQPCAAAAPAMAVDRVDAQLADGSAFDVHVVNLGANIDSGFDPSTLDIRIEGKELSKLGKLVDRKAEVVTFFIKRLPDDRAAWQGLLGSPPLDGRRTVVIGVGPAGQADFTYATPNAPTTSLILFRPLVGAGTVVVLELVLLIAVIWLALNTGLLRDGNPATANWRTRPYSLARFQMAFWFVLITGAFLFVWGLTGEYDGIITPQSLTLLGISGATALGATAIDATKAASQANQVASGQSAPPPPKAENFFSDMLTDDSGYVMQRVQAFAWTLILGIVVVKSVYANLSLPPLDGNLLTLMGISSGLYVGFKFPEQQTGNPTAGGATPVNDPGQVGGAAAPAPDPGAAS